MKNPWLIIGGIIAGFVIYKILQNSSATSGSGTDITGGGTPIEPVFL
jgi:hypothetical protein